MTSGAYLSCMAGSAAFARLKADILALVGRVPSGYVTTFGEIGRHTRVEVRHVESILATLDDLERQTVPWWRVVAEGGAVGRHKRRDDQIARLKADGVPLSGAGIVHELADRRIKDIASPPTEPIAPSTTVDGVKPARSRGMKSHAPKAQP